MLSIWRKHVGEVADDGPSSDELSVVVLFGPGCEEGVASVDYLFVCFLARRIVVEFRGRLVIETVIRGLAEPLGKDVIRDVVKGLIVEVIL